MRILMVFNPDAARVRQRRIDKLDAAFIEAGHSTSRINSHDRDLEARARLSDCVCIIGGDGTVRDAMSRIGDLSSSTRIAVYPLGTINLIAREAGYVVDHAQFVKRATGSETPNNFHIMNMNDRLAIVCASIGPDAEVVAGVNRRMKRRYSRFAYLVSALKLLHRWPRHRLQVTVDGQAFECEAAYVLNGKFYAGPWTLDADANLRNPSMQVLLMPKARRRDYLRLIAAKMVHPIFADVRWHRQTGSSVSIISARSLPVQADGDITATLPVNFSIRPKPVAFG